MPSNPCACLPPRSPCHGRHRSLDVPYPRRSSRKAGSLLRCWSSRWRLCRHWPGSFLALALILVVASDFRFSLFSPAVAVCFDHFNRDDHRLLSPSIPIMASFARFASPDPRCDWRLLSCRRLDARLAQVTPRIRAYLPPPQHVSGEAPLLTIGCVAAWHHKVSAVLSGFLSLLGRARFGSASQKSTSGDSPRKSGTAARMAMFRRTFITDLPRRKGRLPHLNVAPSLRFRHESLIKEQPPAPRVRRCDFIVGTPLARELLGSLPLDDRASLVLVKYAADSGVIATRSSSIAT